MHDPAHIFAGMDFVVSNNQSLLLLRHLHSLLPVVQVWQCKKDAGHLGRIVHCAAHLRPLQPPCKASRYRLKNCGHPEQTMKEGQHLVAALDALVVLDVGHDVKGGRRAGVAVALQRGDAGLLGLVAEAHRLRRPEPHFATAPPDMQPPCLLSRQMSATGARCSHALSAAQRIAARQGARLQATALQGYTRLAHLTYCRHGAKG